jgi:hypothetical protein
MACLDAHLYEIEYTSLEHKQKIISQLHIQKGTVT